MVRHNGEAMSPSTPERGRPDPTTPVRGDHGGHREQPGGLTGGPTGGTTPRRGRLTAFWSLPRSVRLTTYTALGVVLLLVAGAVTGVVLVRRPFPQVDGTLDLPGLTQPVTVARDDHGIPQLYGHTLADLMEAQGYVSAQDRFFEMDVRRHLTAGRLSELFGSQTLETDEYIRTLGWRRTAAKEMALLQPRTREALQAYADGVNAYLDTHAPTQISVEYSLLALSGVNDDPEPWTPVDSLSWLQAMAWDLRGNMDDEVDRVLDLPGHSRRQVEQLYPAYDDSAHPPIVEQGGGVVRGAYRQHLPRAIPRAVPLEARRAAYDAGARAVLRRVSQGLAGVPAPFGRGGGLGSNSWVVDGQHSSTGAPLLANDPHLGVSLPGIWMQVGLHCDRVGPRCPLDVSGFTFSGIPGVVIGHDADVAWGFTNLGPDVSDLYLEKVEGDRWRHGGRWLPLRQRRETIHVHGGDDVRITVRSTAHGPIVSDVSDELQRVGEEAPAGAEGQRYAVSLAWTGSEPSRTADAILGFDTAHDWASFRRAAAHFAVPAQNRVYADTAGHIGYQAPGRIPIRGPGNDGRWPSAGWRRAADWTGESVAFRALPHELDPSSGFIVTANQEVIGDGYPYYLTSDWDQGYRSTRIRELLQQQLRGGGTVSVADLAAMQLDSRNPMAPVLVPYLLKVPLPPGYWSAGQNLLRSWDFTQPADSAAAAYYNVVWADLLAATFHDELPKDQWPDGGDRWMAVMTRLLQHPRDPWWDDRATAARETRDDVLREAMTRARNDLTQLESRSPSGWSWGAIHVLHLEGVGLGQSGIGPVEWLLNRGGYEVGGGDAAVDAAGWEAGDDDLRRRYTVTWAPSMRMVVSLADLDDSRWVNLTGESGHAFDAHYTDQADLWADGRTLPWAFTRPSVTATTEHTLTLRPAPAR
jgi:penicillin amidase